MTTLNTIIEEEKGRFETVFGETLGLDEPFNNSYVLLHVKPMLKNFLTTAMQRAYEAGRADWLRSEIERLEGETKGLVTLNCYGNCNPRCHDSGKDIALTTIITRYKEELKELESK